MYLPDPIERMEASAEAWADEHVKGNMFKCGCGKMCKIMDANTASPNPYSPLVCPACMDELIEQWKKEKRT